MLGLIKNLTPKKAILAIIIIGYLVFANVLNNQFVWDDKTFIIENPEVHSLNIPKLFQDNMFNHGSYYRPIPAIYFATVYTLFGHTQFFYHFFQISLHIVDVVLIFFLFQIFFSIPIAFFLSLLFLIHPINTESVDYIGSTISVLFAFFGLLAFLLSKPTILTKHRLYIIGCLFLLTCLTKETGVLFIGMVLIYRWLYRKPIKLLLITGCISFISYLFIRFYIGNVYFFRANEIPIMRLSLLERLYTMPKVIFYYIKTVFYPTYLAVAQNWTITTPSFQDFILPLFLLIIFFSLLVYFGYAIRRNKLFHTYLFFSAWFISGAFMHSQIVPLDMTVAERWYYFPLIGLLGMLSVIYKKTPIHTKFAKTTSTILLISVILLLSMRTIIRNTNWSDPITLYSHDLKNNESFDLENSLGSELGNVGKHTEAIQHLKRSVELFPNELNYSNLGLAYENLGNLKNAEYYYKKALASQVYTRNGIKHHDTTYLYLTELLLNKHAYQEMLPILKEGLADYPNYIRFWFYLAYVEYKLGDQKNAQLAATKAYQLNPNDVTAEVYNRITNKLPLNINLTNN